MSWRCSCDDLGRSPPPGTALGGQDPLDRTTVVTEPTTTKGHGRSNCFCDGAIIDETAVVTAAHCLEGEDPLNVAVPPGPAALRATITAEPRTRSPQAVAWSRAHRGG
ncbi:trypsin-like serine protease [Streptomyces sp. XY431]|uniref:trypsin-like serine protease n=1 Tax=Streptomyces sp. XY431 TaxID=1415562 RepID=UPI00336BD3FD